jgi:hypothetical protein
MRPASFRPNPGLATFNAFGFMGARGASPQSAVGRPAQYPCHPRGTLMARVIEVIVSPKGETTIKTRGYAGADCVAASKFMEAALGVVASERRTAEFFHTEESRQQIEQQ